LDGSSLAIRRLRSADLVDAVRVFQNFPRGETNSGLPSRLRDALAHPESFTVDLTVDGSGSMLGLEISSESSPGVMSIGVLRVSSGVLGSTVARHMLWRAVQRAQTSDMLVVRFIDDFGSDGLESALSDIGFIRDGGIWSKPLLHGHSN